jgi:hypothetical protein
LLFSKQATDKVLLAAWCFFAPLLLAVPSKPPQQIKAKEMAVYSTHYSILLPVDTVFNSIDDLANLAGHANSPLTPQQIIGLAYVILAKEPILQQDFCLWNRKPMADRTFAQHARSFLQSPAQPMLPSQCWQYFSPAT